MSWLGENWRWVGESLRAHLFIVLPATTLAVLVSIPIGRSAHHFPKVGGAILSGATLTYAIPSLPLLAVVPLVIGMPLRPPLTIIVALGLYDTALLVRTASDAFFSVGQTVIDDATAVGHSRRMPLRMVELPPAVPAFALGIRVVAASTVGLVTIGAPVEIPSVGTLLTGGLQRGIAAEVVTGVVATVALVLAADELIVLLGRLLMLWTRADKAPGAKGEQA